MLCRLRDVTDAQQAEADKRIVRLETEAGHLSAYKGAIAILTDLSSLYESLLKFRSVHQGVTRAGGCSICRRKFDIATRGRF